MMNNNEMIWDASLEEIISGYKFEKERDCFYCLICGKRFEKGIIYQENKIFYEAEKFVKLHISKEHVSVFDYLISIDKKHNGLSDVQKNLLKCFYKGLSDQETAKLTNTNSISTIRNHRFNLKEHEKQAKVFLAIMNLIEGKQKNDSSVIEIHKTATMVDDRYNITEKENKKYLDFYFKDGLDGSISDFPTKEKRKIIILRQLIKRFETGKNYTEKEVNEILKTAYHDFVTLRRYLIEYGFMDRTNDCSKYWVKI
ncbi:MAG: DUF2087 domain-containing protein [Candidatus Sericytochromatia bacterium]